MISFLYAAVTVQQTISSRVVPWGLATVILAEFVFTLTALRLANNYDLQHEKRLFMDVYDVTTGLRDYRKNPSLTTELEVERLSELSDDLENNWVANFKLAKEVLSPVHDFVEDLKERLIPAVEKGNTNDVDIGVTALARFARLLLEEHPQIAELQKINDLMTPFRPQLLNRQNGALALSPF